MPIKQVTFNEEDIRKIFESETAGKKFKRLFIRTTRQILALGFLFVFFFTLINFGAFWTKLKYSIAAPTETTQSVPIEPPKPVVNYAPELIIPSINITAPIALNIQPSQVVEQLRNGVVHYADTALPGEIGNAVIIGHSSDYPWSVGNYKNIFALLDKLVIGDKITVPYGSQRFVYEVTESKIVKPSDLSPLKKSDAPKLTLITCYPVGTSQKRLVISAKLIEGEPTGYQLSEPFLEELPRAR
ncbi:MAG: class D sortase [Candidatus Berkelbacteria bacterium]|nr:MAG: class D sortase [Candidatus Berkelbacteria bacterium]QQG51385.1 MAG: class D sortase [Candidatus Berkelbacteria bacterium]